MVELVYNFNEKSYREYLKKLVDRYKVRFKMFFGPQTYTYMDTNMITLLCSLVRAGNYPKNKDVRVIEGQLSTVLTLFKLP